MDEIRIRAAVPEDVPVILALIRELARFEKQPDAVVATEADLLRDGWGPTPRFGCAIAELNGAPCGFALWFYNYSTWEGRAGIYLEDLYVSPAARGKSIGEKLMVEVARIAVAEGARRLDLNVLDWNPARAFYHRLGITHRDDWLPYRIDGEALKQLAKRG
ncbi:MAG TPA: GNAT family N-acetyltransferase [Aliidongia sp.]|nr:GNAT family N-acetyltransferase [Aliidongia sp.]